MSKPAAPPHKCIFIRKTCQCDPCSNQEDNDWLPYLCFFNPLPLGNEAHSRGVYRVIWKKMLPDGALFFPLQTVTSVEVSLVTFISSLTTCRSTCDWLQLWFPWTQALSGSWAVKFSLEDVQTFQCFSLFSFDWLLIITTITDSLFVWLPLQTSANRKQVENMAKKKLDSLMKESKIRDREDPDSFTIAALPPAGKDNDKTSSKVETFPLLKWLY